jgi:hypothetical protein
MSRRVGESQSLPLLLVPQLYDVSMDLRQPRLPRVALGQLGVVEVPAPSHKIDYRYRHRKP